MGKYILGICFSENITIRIALADELGPTWENKEDTIQNVEIVNQLKEIRAQLVAIREIL